MGKELRTSDGRLAKASCRQGMKLACSQEQSVRTESEAFPKPRGLSRIERLRVWMSFLSVVLVNTELVKATRICDRAGPATCF